MTSMFTVCPKCALTLAVTASDLRVAQGHVRCGRCSHVFNALTRLTAEDRQGNPLADPAAPAPEEEEPIPEAAFEFNADASKVFVEAMPAPKWTPTGTYRGLGLGGSAGSSAEEPLELELGEDQLYSATLETPVLSAAPEDTAILPLARPRVPRTPQPVRPTRVAAAAPPATLDPTLQLQPPTPPPPEEPPLRHEPVPVSSGVWKPRRIRVPVEPAVDALPEEEEELQGSPALVAPPVRSIRARMPSLRLPELVFTGKMPWVAGCVALSLLLGLQVFNHYRNDLATRPSLRLPLTRLYGLFGVKLVPRWDLAAYDVRQLGASASSARAGQITVRASLKNTARRPQPLPLLRVTLQDRFGNRIAARDVIPAAYLSRTDRSAYLSAGERIDAQMTFIDPGSNAVGFEIDACLQVPGGGTACANDLARH